MTFLDLHHPGDPVVLVNAWDAGSARTIADAGAAAIATGSWSVAAAHGYADGEQLPLDLTLTVVREITAAVDLPVTVDLEHGYGETPADVARSVAAAVDAGAVGCNLEDGLAGGGLRDLPEQCDRLAAAREAVGDHFVLNARTDIFLNTDPATHDHAKVTEALDRAEAFTAAGASSLFVPGLTDAELIRRVVAGSPLPVNVMASDPADVDALAALGVARISFGPAPYLAAVAALGRFAAAAYDRSA
ncbi:isocitrate lyase/phosphoenolpyruvate mutase family protein [Calidifontibacter sp. DB0510]|uniref:Isocitrate lyase/phosphoenolpyruvate mutase family protein n=1 Tax=Metallococcus carri TaxID=1656884 RepID=A0A967B7G5_9MICO|nr:isocitrate lyase/phosphoenolpyruvate mutase family protein [Metallococcus carri]NHN56982.1 isocitrate lyase/phosphoenolpyruvate mutase family protein [Metallococcus carri]NOP37727.1 isocitrate lyase/phosphoenolpyruvate mutase family protein [Calidifontibacter sp. DB2511S]